MKKIVFLVRSLDYGGAQRQVVTLVKSLSPDKFEVTVLCFYSGEPLEEDLKNSNVRVIGLDKGGRWDIFGFLTNLLTQMRRLNPDLIHGYLGVPNILTIFLKPFFPSCRMIWGVRNSQMDLGRYDWLRWLSVHIERFLSPLADLIIVNSHVAMDDHIEKGFPANKMLVIPNGIDTAKFKPDREARLKFRSEWGIGPNTLLIGLIARLDPMKDHQNFLQAAALLSRQRQDVRFICVGTGPEDYAKKLYRLVDYLGIDDIVIWTGAYANMPAVYNGLDIATSTSCYGEGFSNAIGEAMACGLPCVVTDVGDSAWIVGDSGVVVEPNNPEALVAGWVSCWDADRNQLGCKARQRILENFSVSRLVIASQEVFEKTEK
ncbi:glycosyltransferase [Laspinema sp. D1]|uniref:glycosyltransferase n=1 Tax=Laspinema palackyanum TaxID=3231601 RepID=UPI00348C14DA|nr:glycosyltransferase [Laspinema sp. D2b]